MPTDERMEKMEGQLARVIWFNRCLIACIVLSLGFCFVSKTFGPEAASAQSGVKQVRAKRFVVEDENGNGRGILAVTKEGPTLALFDKNGKSRVLLGTGQTTTVDGTVISYPESSLILFGADGRGVWQAP